MSYPSTKNIWTISLSPNDHAIVVIIEIDAFDMKIMMVRRRKLGIVFLEKFENNVCNRK